MNYIIKNATIVNEGALKKGSLYIIDGKIGPHPPTPSPVERGSLNPTLDSGLWTLDSQHWTEIDAEGCYLLPGVIDTHVHFRDGGDGSNPAGDFHTESRAARQGGVTSVVDMPNTTPQTTSLETLEAKERWAAKQSAVNYGFMLGATNDNIEQLLAIDPKRYAAIKLFLGSSTGNMLVNDSEELNLLFREARKLIVAHCEEESVIQANLQNFKLEYQGTPKETAALHPQIRNTEACFLSTYKAINLARKYDTRFHVAHISTATELSLLSNFPLKDKKITAEVTPNHLWFDDRDYAEMGNRIKCNPAIKSNDDRLALWAALHDGLIDTIATDHAPHPWANKEKPYFDAPSGIPSIQHSLQMMLEPIFSTQDEGMIQEWLPLIVEKMCHNPATLFGINQRGFIRDGYHADLVLVKPAPEGRVVGQDDPILYKCGWSPLNGMTFHSQITHVFVNGSLADDAAQKLEFSK